MRSRYDLAIDAPRRLILIEDSGRGLSVTNDAENVIDDLVSQGVDVDRYRIIYRDNRGTWDGLATNRGRFTGFFFIGSKDRGAAIADAMGRRSSIQIAAAGGLFEWP